MQVLLDTHCAAWALGDSHLLSRKAQEILLNPETRVFYSSISIFEMSLKHNAGKWNDVGVILEDVEQAFERLDATELPLYSSHARLAGTLPSNHKDPFDRLIAAQAILEQLVLLSADPMMDGFGVQRIWE